MRIDYRYGAAVGIMAAAFATLGPVAAQADQTPGISVPNCAGACGLEAPAVHIPGIAGIAASRSIVLTSTVDRSSYSYGYGRDNFAFTDQRDRVVLKSGRCVKNWWGGGWHRACKFRHIDKFQHIDKFRTFKHVKFFKPCKRFNYFDNIGHGNFGGYGHVNLASQNSRFS